MRVANGLLRQNRTGSYSARKRLPDDVREEYGRLYGAHFEAKFSAPASDGEETAKQKFRDWDAEVAKRIAAIRAEQRGTGIDLTPKDALALAGDLLEVRLFKRQAMMTCALLLATFSLAIPAISNGTVVPTCAQFRERLESADRVLELRQMPPIRPSREPQESNGDDLWTVDDNDGNEIMDVTCRNGKFFSLEMIRLRGLSVMHPNFDYIAAGIFAFTGWPADKVIKTATDVWNTKRGMMPERQVEGKNWREINPPGLCATISYSEFSIGNCSD